MKYVVFITFFLALECILEIQGWVAISPRNEEKLKGHPNHEAICSSSGVVNIIGCGLVAVQLPCTVEEGDLSKPYPDCCYEIKCPSSTPSAGNNKI
ncbi:hypothetical protein HHI36_019069 [Cryptolaemus montrouzieri]|uniref:Single domain-containing protein n=1 Tax=Cryptolaemus montrouzieri TaxID=559131 RepID=A0ABD2P2L3_9CUCU